jgi:hypothetical protein
MAHHRTFKRKNIPNQRIENLKKYSSEPNKYDWYEIEVFGDGHKKVADDLSKALKESGFLANHPLFIIRVEPM